MTGRAALAQVQATTASTITIFIRIFNALRSGHPPLPIQIGANCIQLLPKTLQRNTRASDTGSIFLFALTYVPSSLSILSLRAVS